MKNLIEDFKRKLKSRGFVPEFFFERKNDISWDLKVEKFNHNCIYYRSNTVIIEFEYYFNSEGENFTFINKGSNPFVFKCFKKNEDIIIFDILFGFKSSNSKAKETSKILSYVLSEMKYKIKYISVPFSLIQSNYFKYYFLDNKNNTTIIEFAIDLKDTIENIWRTLRKSYKSLINKNSKIYLVKNECSAQIWDMCKELHYECSGRKTRSDRTWEIQWEAIKSGNSIVYFIQSKNKVIGFAYFLYDKICASYYVAAFQRNNKFDKSLGHLILWQAIKEFKLKGLKKLYLGAYPTEIINDKSKISNIVSFKKGFSNILNVTFE